MYPQVPQAQPSWSPRKPNSCSKASTPQGTHPSGLPARPTQSSQAPSAPPYIPLAPPPQLVRALGPGRGGWGLGRLRRVGCSTGRGKPGHRSQSLSSSSQGEELSPGKSVTRFWCRSRVVPSERVGWGEKDREDRLNSLRKTFTCGVLPAFDLTELLIFDGVI